MSKTQTKSGMMHISVGIDWMEYHLKEGNIKPQTAFSPGFDRLDETLAYLAKLKTKGLECVPICDKTDAKGYCEGHPK